MRGHSGYPPAGWDSPSTGIGSVLGHLKSHLPVRRACWPPSVYIYIPGAGTIYRVDDRAPGRPDSQKWVPTHADLLAEDWVAE